MWSTVLCIPCQRKMLCHAMLQAINDVLDGYVLLPLVHRSRWHYFFPSGNVSANPFVCTRTSLFWIMKFYFLWLKVFSFKWWGTKVSVLRSVRIPFPFFTCYDMEVWTGCAKLIDTMIPSSTVSQDRKDNGVSQTNLKSRGVLSQDMGCDLWPCSFVYPQS